ncbi:carbonic anhydrase family protein [Chitinibacteraceae bacterium HSL-7]
MSEEMPPVTAAEPQDTPPATGSKKRLMLIIGMAAVAVILLIVLIVMIVLLMKAPPAAPHGASAPAEAGHAAALAPAAHDKAAAHEQPEAHGKPASAHGDDAAALKAEVESLKADLVQQTEQLAMQSEANGLKSEIEQLRAERDALLAAKQQVAEGSRAILSGSKTCETSGDPAKRAEELRACLGVDLLLKGSAAHGAAAPAAHAAAHWTYEGKEGPEHWGDLGADYKTCAIGKTQSPVNLVGSFAKGAPALQYGYQAATGTIVNNGHTIQVNLNNAGGVTLNGTLYKLLQFHFHTPSEEQINGRNADMVMHMVHKSDAGELLVIGVLMNDGKANAPLTPVFANMPGASGEERTLKGALNPVSLLPAQRNYMHFMGSLTTPPCSEGVKWFVMRSPVSISSAQYTAFAALYPYNARPVQPLNGRKVEEN